MRAPTIPVPSLKRTLPISIVAVLGRLDRRVRVASLAARAGYDGSGGFVCGCGGDGRRFPLGHAGGFTLGELGRGGFAVVIAFGVISRLGDDSTSGMHLTSPQWPSVRIPALGEHLTGAVGLLGGGSPSHGSADIDRRRSRYGRSSESTLVEPARVIPWRGPFRGSRSGSAGLVVLAAPLLFCGRRLTAAGAAFSHAVGSSRAAGPARARGVARRPVRCRWGRIFRLGVSSLAAARSIRCRRPSVA